MKRLFLALASSALLMVLAASCTGQGEGQRCQSKNNNDDCQDGLLCGAPKNGGSNFEVCCPASGGTDPLCVAAAPSPGSDASIPDTGTPDTSKPDASEAGSDAADATTDGASSDATSDSADATGQ